ncbi:MAG: segregation and condensation protein B [Bermanella sp.]|jgi:segregation and condensation protein B
MMISDVLLEQVIEGALLASGQTLSIDRIHALFDEGLEPEKSRIQATLDRIGEKCANKGYELKKVATGYRFQVKQDLGKWVSRLWEEKPQRYSRALLETLSIIAYRQPVTRGEIEDVRGVAVSSHITKTLVEREWIQVVGHRDVPGRPAMYATTKMFLDYFNLESLDQLPTLEEIQEIADANHALELEDKTEEGNFDFSNHNQELGDSENLISAAKDMEDADALVQQVEDNLFKQAQEDEEADQLAEQASSDPGEFLDAEQQIAQLDDTLANTSSVEAQNAVNEGTNLGLPEDATDEEIAEATIARMIAEQEQLLNKHATMAEAPSNEPVARLPEVAGDESVGDPHAADHLEKSSAAPNVADTQDQQTSEQAPSNIEQDDAELLAAMEEEMIAQLQAEQEEIQNSRDDEAEEKTLSDLANKFD